MDLRSPPKLPAGFEHLQKWLQELYQKSQNILQRTSVPSASTDPGKFGNYAADATYLYFCYADSSWARIAWTDVVF